MIKTIEWTDRGVVMIDQRRLPEEEIYNCYTTHFEVAQAIRDMVIRGAPAIGVAAAMGIALGAANCGAESSEAFQEEFTSICHVLEKTRPTAVNLFWAIERLKTVYDRAKDSSLPQIKSLLREEALKIYRDDIAINRRMGQFGQALVPQEATILTHCNAGALATAGHGTALGVIRSAVSAGKNIRVLADETRPFLQGSRLTAWELIHDEIPVTLITDNMAGHMMKDGKVQCVIVGADRIAANGDVANKIGTYTVAVLAKENGVPFYVAAPISTLDMSLVSGHLIPIEERDATEVTELRGKRIAPSKVQALNPAFDVTPHRYVTAIITERGVARPPFETTLAGLLAQENNRW